MLFYISVLISGALSVLSAIMKCNNYQLESIALHLFNPSVTDDFVFRHYPYLGFLSEYCKKTLVTLCINDARILHIV